MGEIPAFEFGGRLKISFEQLQAVISTKADADFDNQTLEVRQSLEQIEDRLQISTVKIDRSARTIWMQPTVATAKDAAGAAGGRAAQSWPMLAEYGLQFHLHQQDGRLGPAGYVTSGPEGGPEESGSAVGNSPSRRERKCNHHYSSWVLL
jgi:hypothetical protein